MFQEEGQRICLCFADDRLKDSSFSEHGLDYSSQADLYDGFYVGAGLYGITISL